MMETIKYTSLFLSLPDILYFSARTLHTHLLITEGSVESFYILND